VPVYYSVIRGGYLTSPKYNLRDRVGHVEVEYDQLFTVEDLERMTPAEIESKINHAIDCLNIWKRQSFRWTSLIRRILERSAPAAADTPKCCAFPLIRRSTFGPAPNVR